MFPGMDDWIERVIRETNVEDDITILAKKSYRKETSANAISSKYVGVVELKHAAPELVGSLDEKAPSGEQLQLMWDIFAVLSQNDQLLRAKNILVKMIEYMSNIWPAKTQWDDFDSICTLSSPVLPLAAMLFTDERLAKGKQRRLYHLDNFTLRLMPQDFQHGQKVLLVDTLVHTGWHLSSAYEYIKERGAETVGVVAICLGYTGKGEQKYILPIVDQLRSEKKLLYLYTWAALFDLAQMLKEDGA
jgi:orotate phosphoribosyltransferase